MKNPGEAEVLHRVIIGELGIGEAAGLLGYTARTAYRRVKRFRAKGEPGLVHGLVGRRSNRAKDEDIRNRAIALFRDGGANTSLAKFVARLHKEEGIVLCRESLRRWLLDAGLWVAGQRTTAGAVAATDEVRPAGIDDAR